MHTLICYAYLSFVVSMVINITLHIYIVLPYTNIVDNTMYYIHKMQESAGLSEQNIDLLYICPCISLVGNLACGH